MTPKSYFKSRKRKADKTKPIDTTELLNSSYKHSTTFQRNKLSSQPHLLNQKENHISDFSVYGKIGETEGLIIFDSGAQLSLVDRNVGVKNIENTSFKVHGVTGADLKIYGQTYEKITLGLNIAFEHTLIVADLPHGYIGILGLDVMTKENIDLLISRKSIKVHGKEIFVNKHNTASASTVGHCASDQVTHSLCQGYASDHNASATVSLDNMCLHIYSRNDVNLPARSEIIIPAKLGKICKKLNSNLEGKTVLSEPDNIKMHGVYAARVLSTVRNNGCITKVINCSDEDLILKRNTSLGLLCETNPNIQPERNKVGIVYNNIDQEFKNLVDDKLTHLCVEDKQIFENLLYEFRDIFSTEQSVNLGCTSAVTHKIETGDAGPIKLRPYKIPHAVKPVVNNLIEQQLREGIIVPSKSAWSAPLLILPKKVGPDGIQRWRCAIDYRALNAITKPENYPIPDIRDAMDKLSGSQYFSSIDMNMGYHQICMDSSSREKTAFTVPDGDYVGLYEYVRLPLGLVNAPSTFQRFMDTTLAGLRGKSCLIYLDDCLVYGTDINKHIADLREVLQRFRDANLSVKLEKCKFAVEEIDYLGNTLDRRGVRPSKKNLDSIKKYPRPTTVREVRAYIGLTGYYRRHIPNYANIAKPLTELTKKSKIFIWSAECENAFVQLKEALMKEPVLTYPDFTKPFVLSTDASSIGIGAILSHVIDGQEHPICYASRQLSKCERNYTATELELLAVIWAVKYFRCYLTGVHFTLYTDHAAIKWLLSLTDNTSRLTRWALKLAQYNYTVVHKPGKLHLNVDALSRIVLKTAVNLVPVIDLDTIRAEQQKDKECQRLKTLKTYKLSPQGIIYYGSGENKQILLPEKLREKIMHLHHDIPSAGHGATLKTLKRIKTKFVWPNMKDDVREFVRKCHSCSQRNNYGKGIASLGKFNEPKDVFQRISCDIVGPLPVTAAKHKYVLSVVDHFSRYTEFIAISDQTSETVARALVHSFITRFGVPKEILTDQGSSFTAELVANLCKFLRIQKLQTTAYHPMSNGRTEITHKTLARMLSHYVNKYQNDWDEYLPYVCMAYNSQYHESLGYSPYEIVFGREMNTPLESDLNITDETERFDEHIESLRCKLAEIKQVTQKFQKKSRVKQKSQYDKRSKPRQFYEGQKVYLYVPQIKRYRVKKLSKLWRGPYRIIKVISEHNVTIRVRKRDVTVHVNRLKPVFEKVCVNNENTLEVGSDEPAGDVIFGDERRGQEPEPEVQPCTSDQLEERGNETVSSQQSRPQRTRRRPLGLQHFIMD